MMLEKENATTIRYFLTHLFMA